MSARPVKVFFAEAARRDLVEIARYIAHDDPVRARAVATELRERALDLAAHPEAFARITDPVDVGFRRRVVGRYVIIYRWTGDQVDVARVLHAARDVAHILESPH